MTGVPRSSEESVLEVSVNCPDQDVASSIAETVVSERLAAAVNILPSINSLYRWNGRIERAAEVPLVIKTRRSLFNKLTERIVALHPYETPSIIARDVSEAYEPYRSWVHAETT